MNRFVTVALAVALCAFSARAQNQPDNSADNLLHRASPLLAALDANNNGVLEAEEIANAGKSLLKLDADKNGTLAESELQPANPDKVSTADRNRSALLMTTLDLNGDGQLDGSEIAEASRSLLKLDTDGDGQLSKNELSPGKAADADDRSANSGRHGGSGDHVAKPGENKPN